MREPGVYDLPPEEYHADDALSASKAKLLLHPSVPAKFGYPPEHKAEFDFGTAAHTMILGNGPELVPLDFEHWKTKASQAARDELRAAGKHPILRHEYNDVVGMAEAIQAHPRASELLWVGKAEQSLWWNDHKTATPLRGRLDWLGNEIVDYKTARSAEPYQVAKAIADYKYHLSAAWYMDGVQSLGLISNPRFLFIFQEKTAPYLVTVAELDEEALITGRVLMAEAIDTYVRCSARGEWPGYSDDVLSVELPRWAVRHSVEDVWGEVA